MENILKNISLMLSVLAVSVIVAYTVFAWAEPGNTPPNGNVAAPINTGSSSQGRLGNLGIGTTSPSQKLEVYGPGLFDWAGGSNGIVYLGDTNHGIKSTSGGGVTIFSYGVPSGIYLQQSTGNVGIGTPSPVGKLSVQGDVNGTSRTSQIYITGNANTNQKLYVGINTNNGATTGDYASIEYLQEMQHWGNLALQADGGNVGIGTASPGAKLTVNGLTGTAMSATFQTNAGALGTTAGNELALASIGGTTSNQSALGARLYREASGSDWTTSGIQLAYDVDNSPRAGAYIELSHSGNVGIGTGSPAYKLDVSGAVNSSIGYYLSGAPGGGINNRFSAGNGDGASSATVDTEIVSWWGIGMRSSCCGHTTDYGIVFDPRAGTIMAQSSISAAAFYYTSDQALKKNIIPLSDSIGKLDELKPVSFDWKSDGKPSIGLIAQDVEKVYPEIVSVNQGNGLKSVDYGKLVAPLIDAVKTQQQEISALKSRVDELQAKIDARVN